MKWFLSRRAPEIDRLLLVESGPRGLAEQVIPRLRGAFGADLTIDLLTCLPTDPQGLNGAAGRPGRVWRVIDCASGGDRRRLLGRIRRERYPAAAMLCAGDRIMFRWKAAGMLLFPSKILIVNENADFFWLDRGEWRTALRFALGRGGLLEESAVRTVARVAAFPFSFAYLLAYAGWVHLSRAARLALGLHRRS